MPNVAQIADFVNTATKEVIGEEAIQTEDLSNIVDIGRQMQDVYNPINNPFDLFVRSLVNQIGKVIFWDRPYASVAPSVLMDAWRYGSILEKIRTKMPSATETDDWQLEDGVDYSPYVVHIPTVSAKFFNDRTTFSIEQTIARKQVECSFQSAYQMQAFVSMLTTWRANSFTIKNDALINRTIATAAANAYYHGTLVSGAKATAYNLLTMYNNETGASIASAEAALRNEGFIRYAIYKMALITDLMRAATSNYNTGDDIVTFTPPDRLHMVMLSDFARSAGVYLHDAPNQFNIEKLALPTAESVPFWQAMGTGDYATRAKIMIKHSGINSGTPVTVTNLLAVAFDHDALGVTNYDATSESVYNQRTSTTNIFDKRIAGYFNDFDEQCVVFTAN